MGKLKGLLLTEGLHGMISQVEGLAKALDLDYFHEKVELNSFWKLIPPKLTPVKKFVFKNNIKKDFDLIISCGRKSVIPSIYLKKINSKKIKNIHVQDPKVNFKNFDYIISPEHDDIKADNVISSKGAIHYLTSKEIDEKKNYLLERISKEKKIITFILGGPTKYYAYSNQNLLNIFSKISKQVLNNNFQVIVIPSNRTPSRTIDLAKKFFSKEHLIIDKVDKDAYLSSLGIADYIIVTCDSSSMISEAALTGKPLYVAMIPPIKKDIRFQKFRKLFESMNILREFDDKLEVWNYEKLDETKRIAYELKKNCKMSFLNSLNNNSSKFSEPFDHWELNKPLTEGQINEIIKAEIDNPIEHNINYDGTRAIDGGQGEFREGISDGGKALKFRCFITKENEKNFPALKSLIEELQNKETHKKISKLINKDLSNSYVRVEVICDRKGFWLKPHCDIKEKLMSCLLFVNKENESEELGTDFYNRDLKLTKTVPYRDNYGYFFSSGPNTWHGMEKKEIVKERRCLQVNYVTFKTDWKVN